MTSLIAALWGAALLVAFVTFTIFATRVVRPAGYLVVVLGAVPVIEAMVRIVLGAREIRASRAPRAHAEALPSARPPASDT